MATTRPACSLGPGALLLLALLASPACTHPAPDDLTLSTTVKIELLGDRALGAQRLDVSTLNGVVTLSGTVRSQADADRAVAMARRVKGVRGVTSALKVDVRRPTPDVRGARREVRWPMADEGRP